MCTQRHASRLAGIGAHKDMHCQTRILGLHVHAHTVCQKTITVTAFDVEGELRLESIFVIEVQLLWAETWVDGSEWHTHIHRERERQRERENQTGTKTLRKSGTQRRVNDSERENNIKAKTKLYVRCLWRKQEKTQRKLKAKTATRRKGRHCSKLKRT